MKRIHSHAPVSGRKLAFTVFACAAFAISAAGARAWLMPAPDARPATSAQGDAPGDAGKPRVESEVITLTPTGFSPSEITRPRGRFLVVLDDRSGLDEVTFILGRANGDRVREARRTKAELIWRQLEDLPPGEYLLTEAGHPEWVCRITITPH